MIDKHGELDEIRIGDLPKPKAEAGTALIKVEAGALNHLDLFTLEGLPGLKLSFPHIMGCDGAGIVEEINADGPTPAGTPVPKVGDRVVIQGNICCQSCESCKRKDFALCSRMLMLGEHLQGSFCEYAVVPVSNIQPAPSHLSTQEAAALPLVYLTAWRMLMSRARVQSGETILIVGIGGGVALAALSLSKALGLKTIVTSRQDDKLQKAKALGADEAFSSTDPKVYKQVKKATDGRGVDVVFDSTGAATWDSSLRSLVTGGRYVTCGATTGSPNDAQLQRIFWFQLSILGSTMGSYSEFAAMLKFVDQKKLKPAIDQVFPIDKAKDALTRLKNAEQFGKIVLDISGA